MATIAIHQITKDDLDRLHLAESESYDGVIKRLIKFFDEHGGNDEIIRTLSEKKLTSGNALKHETPEIEKHYV